jgi:signal transduction histidine kinase
MLCYDTQVWRTMNRPARPLPSIRTRLIVSLVIVGSLISLLSAVAMRSDDAMTRVLLFVAVALLIALTVWRFSIEVENQLKAYTDRLTEETETCRATASEATSILSDFMYYVAHVLRTPANAIRWSVESLKNEEPGPVNEAQREVLDTLESSSVKLVRVAADFQDALLVIRGEQIHMRPVACDLPSIIDSAAGRMAVAMRRRGIRLQWHAPSRPLPAVRCDPDRVEQLIGILLDNAVKYSPSGRIVTVTARLDRGSVVVSVADHGVGIPKKEQPFVFRAFYRGAQARHLWVDGKGVGLMLGKAIAEGCGGTLSFSSHPGKGTVMRFTVPVIPS